MKGRRTKPREECERGRIVKTSTEQSKKQTGAFNMKIVVEWKESMTEMRTTLQNRERKSLGKKYRVLTHP